MEGENYEGLPPEPHDGDLTRRHVPEVAFMDKTDVGEEHATLRTT